MIRNALPDAPAAGVLGDIALTTVVLVVGVMVPALFLRGIALGYTVVLDVFGWR